MAAVISKLVSKALELTQRLMAQLIGSHRVTAPDLLRQFHERHVNLVLQQSRTCNGATTGKSSTVHQRALHTCGREIVSTERTSNSPTDDGDIARAIVPQWLCARWRRVKLGPVGASGSQVHPGLA